MIKNVFIESELPVWKSNKF